MELIISVETRLYGRTLEVREVTKLERTASGISPEVLGLTLQDGKIVLKRLQERMVRTLVRLLAQTERLVLLKNSMRFRDL